jgi:hypothetical protein
VGNPYPPLQAFVHEEVGSRAATGMDNGPCPWSVKELPDIIIAVIRRLHGVRFYIKPGPKVQWKKTPLPRHGRVTVSLICTMAFEAPDVAVGARMTGEGSEIMRQYASGANFLDTQDTFPYPLPAQKTSFYK